MRRLRSRLSLCWTFPAADYFPSSETPMSIILFPLFLFRTGQAVVLLRHIYWPLLASTCSPLKALVCWPNVYILSLSLQCSERNSIFGISAIIYCAVENNRCMVKVLKTGTKKTLFKGVIYRIVSSLWCRNVVSICVSMCRCECEVPCAEFRV